MDRSKAGHRLAVTSLQGQPLEPSTGGAILLDLRGTNLSSLLGEQAPPKTLELEVLYPDGHTSVLHLPRKQLPSDFQPHPKDQALLQEIADAWAVLGWRAIFLHHPDWCLSWCQISDTLRPKNFIARTNLLHGYLLTNNRKMANDVYDQSKELRLQDGRTFGTLILQDFDEFKKAGLNFTDIEWMRSIIEKDNKKQDNTINNPTEK